MDYADQTRNDVNYKNSFTRNMPCPNRFKLRTRREWADPRKYEAKAKLKYPECPSGRDGKVDMFVRETGIWTTIKCPICGYTEAWSGDDGEF